MDSRYAVFKTASPSAAVTPEQKYFKFMLNIEKKGFDWWRDVVESGSLKNLRYQGTAVQDDLRVIEGPPQSQSVTGKKFTRDQKQLCFEAGVERRRDILRQQYPSLRQPQPRDIPRIYVHEAYLRGYKYEEEAYKGIVWDNPALHCPAVNVEAAKQRFDRLTKRRAVFTQEEPVPSTSSAGAVNQEEHEETVAEEDREARTEEVREARTEEVRVARAEEVRVARTEEVREAKGKELKSNINAKAEEWRALNWKSKTEAIDELEKLSILHKKLSSSANIAGCLSSLRQAAIDADTLLITILKQEKIDIEYEERVAASFVEHVFKPFEKFKTVFKTLEDFQEYRSAQLEKLIDRLREANQEICEEEKRETCEEELESTNIEFEEQ